MNTDRKIKDILDCISKQIDFKEIYAGIEIQAGDDVLCINKFLTDAEIEDALKEYYDFWGYDIIPIAVTDYDDYICLYYKDESDNPSIIYWNYELVLENEKEGIVFLYGNMSQFEAALKHALLQKVCGRF